MILSDWISWIAACSGTGVLAEIDFNLCWKSSSEAGNFWNIILMDDIDPSRSSELDNNKLKIVDYDGIYGFFGCVDFFIESRRTVPGQLHVSLVAVYFPQFPIKSQFLENWKKIGQKEK